MGIGCKLAWSRLLCFFCLFLFFNVKFVTKYCSFIHGEFVLQEYYGKILKQASDLKTNACVPSAKPIPAYIRKALTEVHPEVTAK